MQEWNIQSRASACEACGTGFADKQPYHTMLFDDAGGLRRQDICEGCWQKLTGEGAATPAPYLSHWQGGFEMPRPVTEAIQKETAETVLRRLVEQNDPAHAPAAYILAVMLERKRLLKIKEELKRDGRRTFIYEHPPTGDIFSIEDPDLRLDQLQQVQADVAQLLQQGSAVPAEDGVAGVPEAVTAPAAEPVAIN